MNSATAKKALRLTNQITTRILESIHRVKANASEHAALHYRQNALAILDPLSDIVFNLWARFPELKPKSEPGVVYYDPDKWNMPKTEVRRAARELAQTQSDLERLVQLLEVSPERADKPLKPAAAATRKHIAHASFAVLRQDPEFRKAEMAKLRRRAKR